MEQLREKLIKTIGEKETTELLQSIEKYIDRNPTGFKSKLGMLKMFLK